MEGDRYVTKAARVRDRPGEWLPEAPAPWLQAQPWKKVDLIALHSTISEDPAHRTVRLGLVPVQGGRIVMNGALCLSVGLRAPDHPEWQINGPASNDPLAAPAPDGTREQIWRVLRRRYLIAWSAASEAALLDELFGGGRIRWLRRAVDVRTLACLPDRVSGRSPGLDPLELSPVARRFRVPEPPPQDPLDSALMTAELFLILATKVAALGYDDVGSLLSAH